VSNSTSVLHLLELLSSPNDTSVTRLESREGADCGVRANVEQTRKCLQEENTYNAMKVFRLMRRRAVEQEREMADV
jgi:hypothetical protein